MIKSVSEREYAVVIVTIKEVCMLREFIGENKVTLIVVGTVVGVVAVALIATGGDLAAYGEFLKSIF